MEVHVECSSPIFQHLAFSLCWGLLGQQPYACSAKLLGTDIIPREMTGKKNVCAIHSRQEMIHQAQVLLQGKRDDGVRCNAVTKSSAPMSSTAA